MLSVGDKERLLSVPAGRHTVFPASEAPRSESHPAQRKSGVTEKRVDLGDRTNFYGSLLIVRQGLCWLLRTRDELTSKEAEPRQS